MQDSDKKIARDLLIRVKLYRMFTTMFAMVAIGIVLSFYYKFYDAEPLKAAKDPLIILFILCPFVPALVFSRKAAKAEKALKKMLAPPADGAKPAEPAKPADGKH